MNYTFGHFVLQNIDWKGENIPQLAWLPREGRPLANTKVIHE